jgi:flagellar hook assembly protein FlgD
MARPSASAATHAWLGRTARIAGAREASTLPAVTRLSFALPRAAHTSIRVHDANSRIVRTLQDGTLEPGEHVCIWDGLDDQGNKMSAGDYTLRIEVDTRPLTSRIVTLR